MECVFFSITATNYNCCCPSNFRGKMESKGEGELSWFPDTSKKQGFIDKKKLSLLHVHQENKD